MDQEYFAVWNKKSWKPQNLIITVVKLPNLCAYSWQGLAVQVVLYLIFLSKWSVKRHCIGKILIAVSETFYMKIIITLILIN